MKKPQAISRKKMLRKTEEKTNCPFGYSIAPVYSVHGKKIVLCATSKGSPMALSVKPWVCVWVCLHCVSKCEWVSRCCQCVMELSYMTRNWLHTHKGLWKHYNSVQHWTLLKMMSLSRDQSVSLGPMGTTVRQKVSRAPDRSFKQCLSLETICLTVLCTVHPLPLLNNNFLTATSWSF